MKKNIKRTLLLLSLYFLPLTAFAHGNANSKIVGFSIGSGYNMIYGMKTWKEAKKDKFENKSQRVFLDALTINGEINLLFSDNFSAGINLSKSPQIDSFDNYSFGVHGNYNLLKIYKSNLFIRGGLSFGHHLQGDCEKPLFDFSKPKQEGEKKFQCKSDLKADWLNFPNTYANAGLGLDLFPESTLSVQPILDLKFGTDGDNFTPWTSFNLLLSLKI